MSWRRPCGWSVARAVARTVAVEWRSVGLVGVVGQAAGRYSLMSPAQVVCRWIGWPGPIAATVGPSGCSLAEGAVRPVGVVVLDVVVEEAAELVLVPDEGAVEEFVADRAHPPLRERVRLRRAWRRRDRLGADGAEHVVEAGRVLAGAVVDDEADPLLEAEEEVAGLLGGPGAGRVGGDPGEVDAAGVDLDEEQHVEAAQQHGVDGEEVRRDHGAGLGADERRPRRARPLRGRVPSGVAEDPPHRRRRDPMAELGEFAVDAPVTPRRVLRVQPQDQPADLRARWAADPCVESAVGSSGGRRDGDASPTPSPAARSTAPPTGGADPAPGRAPPGSSGPRR